MAGMNVINSKHQTKHIKLIYCRFAKCAEKKILMTIFKHHVKFKKKRKLTVRKMIKNYK